MGQLNVKRKKGTVFYEVVRDNAKVTGQQKGMKNVAYKFGFTYFTPKIIIYHGKDEYYIRWYRTSWSNS
jgi:hypothetical protein